MRKVNPRTLSAQFLGSSPTRTYFSCGIYLFTYSKLFWVAKLPSLGDFWHYRQTQRQCLFPEASIYWDQEAEDHEKAGCNDWWRLTQSSLPSVSLQSGKIDPTGYFSQQGLSLILREDFWRKTLSLSFLSFCMPSRSIILEQADTLQKLKIIPGIFVSFPVKISYF